MATRPILILSGPIAAGKTTVARELVPRLEGPVAYIEGDRFWSFIATPASRRPSPTNFKMIMTAMIGAAVPYALHGYAVVVDFSMPPWFLETARKVASVREVPIDYVVLRPSEAVCAARAAARAEGRIDDYSRYRELYADFENQEPHVIANDGLDPRDAADRIRAGLTAGTFRLAASPPRARP